MEMSGFLKTSPTKRVVHRDGKVFAVETRNNVWVMAQFVMKTRIAFFECFSKGAKFREADWKSAKLLHIVPYMYQFCRDSNIAFVDATPRKVSPPEAWINVAVCPRYDWATLWEGTSYERKVKCIKGGCLESEPGGNLVRRIKLSERRLIDRLELSGSVVFPSHNYRLHLCYLLGRNVDPIKDLYFRREMPLEYIEYLSLALADDE